MTWWRDALIGTLIGWLLAYWLIWAESPVFWWLVWPVIQVWDALQ